MFRPFELSSLAGEKLSVCQLRDAAVINEGESFPMALYSAAVQGVATRTLADFVDFYPLPADAAILDLTNFVEKSVVNTAALSEAAKFSFRQSALLAAAAKARDQLTLRSLADQDVLAAAASSAPQSLVLAYTAARANATATIDAVMKGSPGSPANPLRAVIIAEADASSVKLNLLTRSLDAEVFRLRLLHRALYLGSKLSAEVRDHYLNSCNELLRLASADGPVPDVLAVSLIDDAVAAVAAKAKINAASSKRPWHSDGGGGDVASKRGSRGYRTGDGRHYDGRSVGDINATGNGHGKSRSAGDSSTSAGGRSNRAGDG